MKFLPREILESQVEGRNLTGHSFEDNLPQKPSLVVFLRHLGCIFCRETVEDLRVFSSEMAAFPPILFVYPESVREGEEFFSRFWPEAKAISNPNVSFYEQISVQEGNLIELAGPEVWVSAVRALAKGNFYGVQGRHLLRMPGVFLVLKDRILWSHSYRHIGDEPDWSKLPGCTPLPTDEYDPGILPA
ncbi:AhpC/TSA family protein [Leptospira koniambonensis]|uniref:AhpC/TSA family protein n=1 Tax=Leptospira koniambonensis TaxID=2484950 RepID=A0A4R9J4P3_9LEPT|nr:SelL-related redox protein [Leptospira koniambonensis]TGL28539.1 AhpC/TSA family protein [Leptospira koniambonensis]